MGETPVSAHGTGYVVSSNFLMIEIPVIKWEGLLRNRLKQDSILAIGRRRDSDDRLLLGGAGCHFYESLLLVK